MKKVQQKCSYAILKELLEVNNRPIWQKFSQYGHPGSTARHALFDRFNGMNRGERRSSGKVMRPHSKK
jgi:hypothetical protein